MSCTSAIRNTFLDRIRSCCHAIDILFEYCSYGFFSTNPKCSRCQNCNALLNTVFIIAIFCLTTWLVLQQNTWIRVSTLPPSKISYESNRIQIPHYLLLDLHDRTESKCKQIFRNVIPNQLPATCTYTAATTLVLVVFILIIAIGIFLISSFVASYFYELNRCIRNPTSQTYMAPAVGEMDESNTFEPGDSVSPSTMPGVSPRELVHSTSSSESQYQNS
ncbi:unnamed protein product [Adineta steineri]|uniref:Uncharacterized protein n=1 Tax=Adineta steineri TaxID=433720 RepID=A0A814MSW2_9BILA|nr:unnamed protein product [Adineta steineri]